MLSIVFVLYLVILAFTMSHHEMWGDEVHSWNIAKGSSGFIDLISNTRFEGHPPVWYVILWAISKFTHNLQYVQAVHFVIISLSVFLLLYFSPLPLFTRMLIPFGYYFLFEYAVLSRNYAIGILLAFCICVIIRRAFRYQLAVYYLLLFLLANTHLLGLMLAASLHVYFFLLKRDRTNKIPWHALAGLLLFIPSLYFIVPPSEGGLNFNFWISKWNRTFITMVLQTPVRAFAPMPAWWDYNFWNTEFILSSHSKYGFLKYLSPLLSAAIVLVALWVLKASRKALVLFSSNLALSLIIALIIPLTTARYAGFIFIGFLVAYWQYCYEKPTSKMQTVFINIMLFIQIIAGVFAVAKDIRYDFSKSYQVNELIGEVPPGKRVVSDYWALNTIAAFRDTAFYCVDLKKDLSFMLWDKELALTLKDSSRIYHGVQYVFEKEKINELYMISTASEKLLMYIDKQLFNAYNVELADKREGAIEKTSNLYLYHISTR
jgi:hypothetical protein